jgi:hypothetical protein
MRAAGHTLTIYTYDPEALHKCGLHDDIRDAREIINEADPSFRYFTGRRFTLFSNIMRLQMQRQSRGIWVDLDCYMVRPLRPTSKYVFGYSKKGRLNGAVLQLPAGVPMVEDYYTGITANPLRVPWATLRRIIYREMEILVGRALPSTTIRTNIGPRALSYYAKKHGLMDHALPITAFYPVASRDAGVLADPDDREARASISEDTIIVHFWQGKMKRLGLLNERPAATSFIGQAFVLHGM